MNLRINANIALRNLFGIKVEVLLPRGMILFAKEYFNGKRIDAIEIGTLRGDHAKSMVKSLNINRLLCIDPYDQYDGYLNDSSCSILPRAKRTANKKLSRYTNVKFIEDYSENAYHKIKGKYDLIYIDGKHDSPYIDKDIDLYYNLLKDGGIIGGHDFYKGCDVIRAVLKFVEENKLNLYVGKGSDWWVIKR